MTYLRRSSFALCAILLLAGCATAAFRWVGKPFLPADTSLISFEEKLDTLRDLPTYHDLVSTSAITRNFDARQGTPATITYTWVNTYEGSFQAGIGVIDGTIGTITTEALAATFAKDTGKLIAYETYHIPGLTHKQIELSTTPIVGAAFAVWLATQLSAAISDAGDNISDEIEETDRNVSREIDEVDDEAEERIKRHVNDEANKIRHEIDDALNAIRNGQNPL